MQARGLLIFIRNAALFLLIMGLISLAAASQQGQWQLPTFFAISSLIIVLLVIPWHTRKHTSIGLAAITAAIVIVVTITSDDARLAIQAIVMLLASGACAILAGVIGFYNSCLVLLYAYFADITIGSDDGLSAAAAPSLKKVTAMIRAASKVVAEPSPSSDK